MGTSPTLGGVAGPKTMVVEEALVQGRATVASVTTMTAVAAVNGVQQGQEHLGEFPRRHLTGALDLHFNLCSYLNRS
jgi:hypothetical protein